MFKRAKLCLCVVAAAAVVAAEPASALAGSAVGYARRVVENGVAQYGLELEITPEDPTVNAVSVASPLLAGAGIPAIPLEFDNGENHFDAELFGFDLDSLNLLLGAPFELTLSNPTQDAVYSLDFTSLVPAQVSDFPNAPTHLTVIPSIDPTRPIALWGGGDPNADGLLLTYSSQSTGDEFLDGVLPPTTEAPYTMVNPLADDSYTVTLDYLEVFAQVPPSLTSGPDLLNADVVTIVAVSSSQTSHTVDSTDTPGDFEPDGDVDVDDVEALQLETRSPSDFKFDIDGDFDIDDLDFQFHRDYLAMLLPGDTEGDFDIDNDDLFLVLGANKFNAGPSNALWSEGDFNNDGQVNNDDLFLVLGTNQFNQGQYNALAHAGLATVIVPEPAGLAILIVGSAMLGSRRR